MCSFRYLRPLHKKFNLAPLWGGGERVRDTYTSLKCLKVEILFVCVPSLNLRLYSFKLSLLIALVQRLKVIVSHAKQFAILLNKSLPRLAFLLKKDSVLAQNQFDTEDMLFSGKTPFENCASGKRRCTIIESKI